MSAYPTWRLRWDDPIGPFPDDPYWRDTEWRWGRLAWLGLALTLACLAFGLCLRLRQVAKQN